jgi:hypothetical protein
MELTHTNGIVPPEGRSKPGKTAVHTPLVRADQATMVKMWSRVRRGCLAIKAHDTHGDMTTWDASHVRMQLDLTFNGRGTAELWQIKSEQGEDLGFGVTIIGNCPYRQVPQSLIIWIVYAYQPIVWFGLSGVRRARAILAQIEQHGRDLGLEFVDGYSTNIQWMKWLMRVDPKYRCAQFMFRKNLF